MSDPTTQTAHGGASLPAGAQVGGDDGLYQQILAHTQGLLCSFDLSGRLLTVNRDAGALLGLDTRDMLGRDIREFVAAEHAGRFDEHLATVTAEGSASGLLTLRRLDGSTVAVHCRSFTCRLGDETCVVSQGVDVTARTRAEEMNRRFGLVIDGAPDLVAVASVAGDLLFLNRAGRALCGIPPEGDLSGLSLATLHPEAEVPAMLAAVSTALHEGACAGETRIRTHSGAERPAEYTIVSPRDHDTGPDFVAYVLRDVSERARYQEVLRRNERRFRDVIDNVAEVLFETDVERRWTFLNSPWRTITGFNVSDALHRDSGAYVHPADVPLHAAELQQIIDGASERTYAVRGSTRDGRWCWMEVHARRRVDAQGACLGTTGSLRDVTRQRELSEQLATAHRAAVEANGRLSDLVANISHEIRTPLNGVIGLASALLDTTLGGEQRDYAEQLQASAEGLLSLVNGVLDLSRIESGELTVESVPFVLRDVVSRGLEPAFTRARRKGLAVDLTVDPALPSRVVSDPGRLRQVLLNLVDNAVKFTATGRVTVRLVPATTGRDLAILAEVTDTGIGIDPDEQAAIFEKFKQAHASVARRFGGTGLGLAICRQLVERLGGEIGVRSVPGEGSTFWFRLPVLADEAVSVAPRPATPRLSRPARVLVVEDNATNQLVARLMLERIGCTVTLVSDGAEAVAAATHVAYDAILMDCQMPVMDGYEATGRIRGGGACARVPIIAMTALAIAGDRERCLASGMSDYLTKPLQTEVLVSALNRALASAAPAASPSAASPGSPGAPGATPLAAAAVPVKPATPAAPVQELVEALPVVDLEPVTQMLGDPEVTRQLVSRVMLDLPRYRTELTEAAGQRDWPRVARVAHALGGCVSNVNAARTSATARRLEHAIKDGDLRDVEPLAAHLALAASELAEVLEAWSTGGPQAGGAAA